MLLLLSLALATDDFQPSAFEVAPLEYTVDADGGFLWQDVYLLEDPGFHVEEEFVPGVERQSNDHGPFLTELFGTARPASERFLLHSRNRAIYGTPVLFVHGAGDNGSGFPSGMATHLAESHPVFAITFAHPHGDVMLQAEAVANAISTIQYLTDAPQVDIVAHSKGGPAAVTYVSNHEDASWPSEFYESEGTVYRGDVRRLVLLGTPLAGLDTTFRWTSGNLVAPEDAVAPNSWSAHYPATTANLLLKTDLTGVDFLPEGGDPFPGQRQILERQPAPLPGSLVWLGPYALQQDWFTTYEGGLGFVSDSDGIDAAIEAGGFFMDALATNGADPAVDIFVAGGTHPLLPTGLEGLDWWGSGFTELGWRELVDQIDEHVLPLSVSDGEISALASGEMLLGEVSARSDGLLMTDSAVAVERLGARGAVVSEVREVPLSHVGLMLANEAEGIELIAAADRGEGEWKRTLGQRYIDHDMWAWVETVLEDPPEQVTTDTAADTGPFYSSDTYEETGLSTEAPGADVAAGDTEKAKGCGCSSDSLGAGWLLALLVFARRTS